MCGIIGIASQNNITDRSWLVHGRDAMRHRGPDDAGEWWSENGQIGLAHRRLSIIDLSHAGHQPMVDASCALTIVFNGEIYNFTELRKELSAKGILFRSCSDTEVILAAYREWGVDCLARFNGMFAFAIYDKQRQTVFLARDRAGEKPLFYHLADRTLRFASELKALLADPSLPRYINREALDCYLSMGFVPGQMCILEGFNKLPPAHAMKFDLSTGDVQVWSYWQLPELNSAGRVDEATLLDELENLFEDSVRRQLVADVPVGVLLSGGVDSSLVTALAVRSTSRVKTFTIRFPGYSQFDETKHARLIAGHFGTDHVELDARDSTVDLLPILARQFDEPIVDSSMIPTYLVSHLVRGHCTVAMGGDGGDELFGGYVQYNRLCWMQRRLSWLPRILRRGMANTAEALFPVGFKGRNWLQRLNFDFRAGLPLVASYFDRNSRRQLMADCVRWNLVAESVFDQRIRRNKDLLQRATIMDFENYLPEDILVKVDRASMLQSLEVRAPLLDYRLIEFAFGKVPPYLKATPASRKILLKKLAARVLPPEFDQRRKQGFSIPLGLWLKSGLWEMFFRDVLLGNDNTLFSRKMLNNLLDGQAKGRSNSERLFGLVLFELWRREYKVTL